MSELISLEVRPNVTGQEYTLEVDSESLRAMSVEQLQSLCGQLGLIYKPHFSKERLLSTILLAADECIDIE